MHAGSSQAKYYTDIAEMVLAILKDADVHPELGAAPMTVVVPGTPPTPVPATGLGKIT